MQHVLHQNDMAEEKACKGMLSWQHMCLGTYHVIDLGLIKVKSRYSFPLWLWCGQLCLLLFSISSPVYTKCTHFSYLHPGSTSTSNKNATSWKNILVCWASSPGGQILTSFCGKLHFVVLWQTLGIHFYPEMIQRLFALCFTPAPHFLCL